MWNLTNQRHSEEKGWTRALETQGKGSGRDAHWANGGNAWAWYRVRMNSYVGKEGLGNPLFLQYWHLAEGAEPEWPELML